MRPNKYEIIVHIKCLGRKIALYIRGILKLLEVQYIQTMIKKKQISILAIYSVLYYWYSIIIFYEREYEL